jgi:hypothetical protein
MGGGRKRKSSLLATEEATTTTTNNEIGTTIIRRNKKEKRDGARRIRRLASAQAAACIAEERHAAGAGRLVVVTSDASGNGNESGLAVIIREVLGGRNNDDDDTKYDTVHIVLGHEPWDESTAAETSALSKGIQFVVDHFIDDNDNDYSKQQDPLRILCIADCLPAVEFFDLENFPNKAKNSCFAQSDEWLQPMLSLLEQPQTSLDIMLTHVRSCKHGVDGFFDHAAADQLAAWARDIQNSRRILLPICNVPHYRSSDVQWLRDSDDHQKYKRQKNKKTSERKQRLRERMANELGFPWMDSSSSSKGGKA